MFLLGVIAHSYLNVRRRKEKELTPTQGFIDIVWSGGLCGFAWAGNLWAPEKVREWKAMDIDMWNNFANLTPRQFERLIAELFTEMGYKTTHVAKLGDFGADIIAEREEDKVVVQVKRFVLKN